MIDKTVLIIVLIVFMVFIACNLAVVLITMRGDQHDKKFQDKINGKV